uniref:Clusterin-associated protein 1 n=1 Tax=Setaria digitata TaxID=48799 RepID=A0A915PSB9_9BILA
MVEQLRVLGYPRLVSMENFRSPNFKLIAELLEWIVHRYDVQISLPLVIDTEQERAIFIKSAAFYILQKARIKLNPKKLYMGEELQKCRQLALQIPNQAATLHDLLAQEVTARIERNKALAYSLSLSDTEKVILQAVQAVQEEITVINRNLQNISSDEAALDAKIERRMKEYDQQQKRLAKLQSFRPQCMDEYEKYESKLKQLYAIYVLKFRNLAFLQQLQTEFDHAEKQRNLDAERNMRNIVEQMRAKQLLVREAQMAGLDEEIASVKPKARGAKIFGNMIGAGISDDDDDDDDDDVNDIIYGNGNDDDDDSDDDANDNNIPYRHKLVLFHSTSLLGKSTPDRSNESNKKLDLSSEDDF